MDWIITHYLEIVFVLWILDQVAAATPKDFKIGKLEIGKYDNVIISFLKMLLAKIVNKDKKASPGS